MIFAELNRAKCKTYLIGCEKTASACLIDPLHERVDRYLAILAYRRCSLQWVIDTLSHADHRTASWDLHDLTGACVVMHKRAPAPRVDRHVEDGEELRVGEIPLRILYTPGHTPDSISIYARDRVMTGDTLLIHGTGRADFAGGDPGDEYDSITRKLFTLPDETLVFPAHDYRGHSHSTIGEEKNANPRLAGHSRAQYVQLMNNLGLPLPDKIQEALQPNQCAIEDDSMAFPDLAQLNRVRQFSAAEVARWIVGPTPAVVVDVREVEEFSGELGHIPGSLLIPLKELSERMKEHEPHKDRNIVVVCRAGVRSTTGAAILTGMGFEHVSNLKGGMLDWNEQKLPVER
jgi:sulfur dioxygenase